jgi:hypothetical protein
MSRLALISPAIQVSSAAKNMTRSSRCKPNPWMLVNRSGFVGGSYS